ncbi:FAD-dependent oxidoreductase [Lutibacter sp.]|uniref:FAD-dependent oxidoreductase n=1 Tax=Lutibacter sp. TaxID=1925666 RepID=UPI0025B7EB7C|nr:FAD-dependent oxidoreductase [Lutibacter sp.]MCF6180935.1 FAD-dependent oxidoreductase [Lutibacter sp.]
MPSKSIYKNHYVAIIGGSISGSEAANILAQSGIKVVVFDMNNLPYGKIEDGLPSWHINLRNRQIKEINKKLDQENVHFVPNTKIGRDIDFLDLINNWGFSAIILANGAWKDRAFPVKGIEKFRDKELIYQNAFINWFNHKHDCKYTGKNYFIKNNAVVVGGGLASLDVIKIVMIELVKKQLFLKKKIKIDLFTLEKEGLQKTLDKYNVTLEDLDIKKARLVYRRTAKEMPLKAPKDDTIENIEKAHEVSRKLLVKYQEKYLFDFIPQSIPLSFNEKNGKLIGVIFQKVATIDGKITPIQNSTFELKTETLISSIGSVPEQIDGLLYENGSLKMRSKSDYHIEGFDNVFAIGNAVTGKGNIQESKRHGKEMTSLILNKDLTKDALDKWVTFYNNEIESKVRKQLSGMLNEITNKEIPPEDIIKEILNKTTKIQQNLGYKSYNDWILKHLPNRLEDELPKNKTNLKCL